MVGGATLTGLWEHQLGAPGASVALVDSILNDQKKMIACSLFFVEGEYGQNDICIGVPCIIGKMVLKKLLKLN
jgi:malate dehydrogenase